jgi:hypothetical protein
MLIKAFRLFVSSTFADFVQERELLQSKVFPSLDAYCAAKGYQFHAVRRRSQLATIPQRLHSDARKLGSVVPLRHC